jgi:hypothetical protein
VSASVADRLALEDVLPAEGVAAVDAVGPVEVLAGVAALNQARAAPAVVDALALGIARAFPARKTAVLVADGGSQDGTPEAVQARRADDRTVPAVVARLTGAPRRGRPVLAVLAAGRRLGARATVLVDGGLVSLTPEWVEALAGPVLHGEADYVSPVYSRAATEGTLTTNLLAPLVRALYGKRVEEVLGGCAAVSAGLVDRLPAAEDWGDDLDDHGVETRLLVDALAGDHAVVEVHLGPKQVDPGAATTDLSHILAGAVGPLFRTMDRYAAAWQEVRGSAPVPRRGAAPAGAARTGDVRPDRMVRAFHLGLKDLMPLWEQVMGDETLGQLYPLGLLGADDFRFPAALWARVVSDFAVAHHERRLPRDHLLRVLTPLYLGRVAAFVLETQAGAPSRVTDALERVGQAFEAEKASLSARWR